MYSQHAMEAFDATLEGRRQLAAITGKPDAFVQYAERLADAIREYDERHGTVDLCDPGV